MTALQPFPTLPSTAVITDCVGAINQLARIRQQDIAILTQANSQVFSAASPPAIGTTVPNTGTFSLVTVTSATDVNAVSITGGAAGSPGVLSVGGVGADTNAGLNISSNGTGNIGFYSSSGANLILNLGGLSGAGTTNFVMANGASYCQLGNNGGSNPVMIFYTQGTGGISFETSNGSKVQLSLNDSGVHEFNNSGSFTANGAKAMSLGSTGPTAANASPQEWLTILDSSGTTRYIPCF